MPSPWEVIGGAVAGAVVGGPVGAVIGAAAASEPGRKVISDTADWTVKTAENGVKVIEKGGMIVVDAIGDVLAAAYNLARGVVGFRSLRPSEREVARAVFKDLLPLDRIVISSLSGAGGKPFVFPGATLLAAGGGIAGPLILGLAPVITITWFIRGLQDKYVMFLGEDGFNHPLNWSRDKYRKSLAQIGAGLQQRSGSQFVHELTHVWQSQYRGSMSWSYFIDSITKRCECMFTGESQYQVTNEINARTQWSQLGVEQQARVVELWYIMNYDRLKSGQPIDPVSQTYHDYIVSNVWTGKNDATTMFTTRSAATALSKGVMSASGVPQLNPFEINRNIEATARGLEAQAKAMEIQARAMIASGSPVMRIQGQATLAQSQALLAQSKAMLSSIGRLSPFSPKIGGLKI